MHGGIGRSINYLEQIENLQRPVAMEGGSLILMDLLWSAKLLPFLPTWLLLIFKLFNIYYLIGFNRSDPTENDSMEGLRPNARGPGLVSFGVR